MKKMTVLYGVFLAFIFAASAPFALAVLQCFFYPWTALRTFVTLAVFAYTVALLPRSERRSGRIFALCAVGVLQVALYVSTLPFAFFVIGSCGVVWLARATLLARSVLHALSEIALMFVALGSAVVAATIGGSITLALWSMLLVLAAGSVTAGWFNPRGNDYEPARESVSRFERAYQSAEQAIAALAQTSCK